MNNTTTTTADAPAPASPYGIHHANGGRLIYNDASRAEANRAELLRAGIETLVLEPYDLRIYLSADRGRLLAWHWGTMASEMLDADAVRDESERGPNTGPLCEAEQYGAREIGREAVELPGGGRVFVRELDAPDAFDGLGWTNRALDYEPPRKDPDEDAPRATVARVSLDGFAADTDEARNKWRAVFGAIAAAKAEADKPRRNRAQRIAQPTLF